MHEELARPWVGVRVPFALTLSLPTFLEKKREEETVMCRRTGYGFLFLS